MAAPSPPQRGGSVAPILRRIESNTKNVLYLMLAPKSSTKPSTALKSVVLLVSFSLRPRLRIRAFLQQQPCKFFVSVAAVQCDDVFSWLLLLGCRGIGCSKFFFQFSKTRERANKQQKGTVCDVKFFGLGYLLLSNMFLTSLEA